MGCSKWVQSPLCLIFLAHVLSSWGDRMWWFAGGIFMKDLAGFAHESLLLVGVYTLVLSGTVLAFGATLGRWIDHTPRLRAIQIILVLQNSLLICCVTTVISMFVMWDSITTIWNGVLLHVLQGFVILTAALSQLASVGTQIIVQKDWIIIICRGNMDQLAKTNSVLRTIDLAAQVIAPFVVGLLRDHSSKLYSAVMIGLWNAISMIVEYYIFLLIYKKYPRLGEREERSRHSELCTEMNAKHGECQEEESTSTNWVKYQYRAYCYDWKTYFNHRIRYAGVGLACLYMTVLGFDAVTTAYGDTQISISLVAAAQGASALIGVLGSASFPPMRKHIQQETIGVIGLSLEITTLIMCVISIWLPGSPFDPAKLIPFYQPSYNTSRIRCPDETSQKVQDPTSIAVLCSGIVASRFGLWLTDITITQIMQEEIEENKRGVINGIQDSLNMGMDMVKSVLVIMFPYPEQFGLLIILSFGSICCGLGSYSFFHYKSRERQRSPAGLAEQQQTHPDSVDLENSMNTSIQEEEIREPGSSHETDE